MTETIIITGIYLLGALIFIAAIRIEAAKQEIPFNWTQLLVGLLWFIWVPFYLLIKLKDLFKGSVA